MNTAPLKKSWTSRPLPQLVYTRLLEFTREPQAVFWVYFFPLLMAFSLGIAFREKPTEVLKVCLVGNPLPNSTGNPASAAGFLFSRETIDVAIGLLRRGRVDAILESEGGNEEIKLKFHTDPTRPESALAKAKLETYLAHMNQPTLEPIPEVFLNLGGLRYIDFLIPGLLGINLMGGGLWGVGYALVDLRVRKLLKRFAATPMRVRDLLLSIAISRFIFTAAQVIILLGTSGLVFGVQIRGGFLDFCIIVILGGFCFLSIGLLVASRATKYETVNGIMNLVMLPMYVFSGVFFSAERFPEMLAPVIRILPLTALNDSLRAIMNEGRSITSLGFEIMVLGLWTAGTLVLAMRLFRWR